MDQDNQGQRTLFVGGLEDQVNTDILRAAFVPFGELLTVEIPMDRVSGKHRGFGFVEFEEEEDAQEAIENMNGAEIFGRVVTVNLAKGSPKRAADHFRPAWADDFFYRKRLADEGMPVDNVQLELPADK